MVVLLVLAAVLLALVAGYVTWVAGRLERAWLRVEAARASLDAQLVRRATAAADLARDRAPPALDHLRAAADQALALAAVPSPEGDHPIVSLPASAPTEWAAAQSGLTRALRQVPREEWTAGVLASVERTRMARQFHNETVLSTRALRRRRVVRYLLLGRNHPLPTFAEFDDEV